MRTQLSLGRPSEPPRNRDGPSGHPCVSGIPEAADPVETSGRGKWTSSNDASVSLNCFPSDSAMHRPSPQSIRRTSCTSPSSLRQKPSCSSTGSVLREGTLMPVKKRYSDVEWQFLKAHLDQSLSTTTKSNQTIFPTFQVSPDGKVLAAACSDRVISLYSYPGLKPVRERKGLDSDVRAVYTLQAHRRESFDASLHSFVEPSHIRGLILSSGTGLGVPSSNVFFPASHLRISRTILSFTSWAKAC